MKMIYTYIQWLELMVCTVFTDAKQLYVVAGMKDEDTHSVQLCTQDRQKAQRLTDSLNQALGIEGYIVIEYNEEQIAFFRELGIDEYGWELLCTDDPENEGTKFVGTKNHRSIAFNHAIMDLEPKLQQVLDLRLTQNKTWDEIGQIMNLCPSNRSRARSRARQLEVKALKIIYKLLT